MHERSERVESPGTYVTEWVSRGYFYLALCSFGLPTERTALVLSDRPGGYHMERGGMPFHDAVEINCKKGATTENQGSDVKYMGKGCILMNVCVCYQTWHDYPALVKGESDGILLLYYYITIKYAWIIFTYN